MASGSGKSTGWASSSRRRLADPFADERRAAVGPGDSDGDLPGRLGLELRDERLQHRGAVGDRAGHRPGVVEGRCEGEAAVERDKAVRRLEADDSAARGGDADRAAGVGSERRVREACGKRGGRAAAGAAGGPAGRDRVRNRAEMRVLRGDAVGELVEVRLADVRVAGALEADDCLGAPVGDVVGEEDRPVGRRQPGGVEEILDGERDAVRRHRRRARQPDPFVCVNRRAFGTHARDSPG